MTEVPEHLLRRSRERRAAATGEAAPAAPAAEQTAGGAVEPVAGAAPATAAGGGGGAPARPAAPAAPAYTGPPQPPPVRQRIPAWAIPVIVGLPFWAILYAGAFGEAPSGEAAGPVAVGAGVYSAAGCGGCHGPTGGGGVGPALGTVTEVFPAFEDHVAWVESGSAAVKGQPYGATGKISTGGMPGFATSLSPEEIVAVVCYERVTFGGEEPPPQCQEGAAAEGGDGGGGTAGGTGEGEGGSAGGGG